MNDGLLVGPPPVKPRFGHLDFISSLFQGYSCRMGVKRPQSATEHAQGRNFCNVTPQPRTPPWRQIHGKSEQFFPIIKHQNCNLDHLDHAVFCFGVATVGLINFRS
jgi:hypothetical protein